MSRQSVQNEPVTLDEIYLTNETLLKELNLLCPGQTLILHLIAERHAYIFSSWIRQEMAKIDPTKKITITIKDVVVTFYCEQ